MNMNLYYHLVKVLAEMSCQDVFGVLQCCPGVQWVWGPFYQDVISVSQLLICSNSQGCHRELMFWGAFLARVSCRTWKDFVWHSDIQNQIFYSCLWLDYRDLVQVQSRAGSSLSQQFHFLSFHYTSVVSLRPLFLALSRHFLCIITDR